MLHHRTAPLWNCNVAILPQKEQYGSFFPGAPRVSRKKWIPSMECGSVMKNWKETRMKRLYTLKMLYKWCSMKKAIHCFFRTAPKINGLYTWNLSRKWQIKINKQDSRISTLKVLYTGSSTQKIISLFLWWST